MPKKPIQLTVLTLSIVIAEEVHEAQVLRKDPPEQLAIPLSANLDDEPDEEDAVAQLFRNVNADRALKEAQAAVKSAAAKAPKAPKSTRKPPAQAQGQVPPDVEVSVTAQRKTQDPDVVIEIEDTPAARERGHMIIAIENPNPNLEVKIDHRTTGQPTIGSTVRFQVI